MGQHTRCWQVAGRVQGVGYRAFVQRHARNLNVTGYARNLPDGTVRVLARGDEAALRRLLMLLRKGPRHARVTSVEEIPIDETALPGADVNSGYAGFVIL